MPLREGRTLHHDVIGRHGAGKVILRAADAGTGIIAGGPMRAVFETLGIQDIVAKSMGTSNPYNMVRATFDALKREDSPRSVAARRGIKVSVAAGAPPRRRRRRRCGGSLRRATMADKTIVVEQIGSPIRRRADQRADADRPRAEQDAAAAPRCKDTPAVRGMIAKVASPRPRRRRELTTPIQDTGLSP